MKTAALKLLAVVIQKNKKFIAGLVGASTMKV
jgi:hypothetical protein